MTKQLITGFVLFMMLLLSAPVSNAQSLEAFEERVTEFTLDNGLHFIIIQRDVAPVASFITHVNVGSVNEPVGQTGITHIFEHVAFKGTPTIGTTNYEEEKYLIKQVDEAYKKWHSYSISPNPNEDKLAELWEAFEEVRDEAQQYVVNNEFSMIVDREGAVGMNAFVSTDETAFFYSLPANKAELWFLLEADRFINPVMREFYEEKDVIWEERRDRTDNNPIGRMIEEFLSIAFSAHPYKNPPIGWPSDIDAVTMEDTIEFYRTYYVPSNLTIAVAGDVDPDQMRRFAEKYFGPMPAGKPSPELTVVEPQQRGERRFVIEEDSQPILAIGYKTVDQMHADYNTINLMNDILFSGRTSRLYQRLVVEEQKALQIQGFNGFPGSRFPGLHLMFAVPNQGIDVNDIETVIYEELERIKNGDVEQSELDRVRTRQRASLIRGLNSNMNLALSFAQANNQTGDWRNIFRNIDDLNEITLEDIQRVAQTYYEPRNRTVGQIRTREEQTASNE